MAAKRAPLLCCHTPGQLEAGLDEAGRGCLAGPVVAAAVVLPPDWSCPLLQDSKKLTHEQRMAARDEILAHAESWCLGILSVADIDRLNILHASMAAMRQALDGLSLTPELALIDGNRGFDHPVPQLRVVKGDSLYQSIAAASILAKTYRDELMDTLHNAHPGYGWQSNRGYPTAAHYTAIETLGITPWHRRSFRLHRQLSMFG